MSKKNKGMYHCLLHFSDILDHEYYVDLTLNKQEKELFPIAFDVLTGKQKKRDVVSDVRTLLHKLCATFSETIAANYENDFENALKLLNTIHEQYPVPEMQNFITITISNIHQFQTGRSPMPLASLPAIIRGAIISITTQVPPVKQIESEIYSDLKWNYLNKRRTQEYEANL